METLKIEIPKGFKIASFDQETGEIKFKEKPKDVMERIRTVADLLADQGLTQDQFDQQCKGLSSGEKAYRILKLLFKSLNEGWEPNWSNSNEVKFIPWFEMGGASGFRYYGGCDGWRSNSSVGSRLCFKSRALADHAGKYFISTYKQFMIIE